MEGLDPSDIIYFKAYAFSFLVHLALSLTSPTVQGRGKTCHLFSRSIRNNAFLISSLIENSLSTLKSAETSRLHSTPLCPVVGNVY